MRTTHVSVNSSLFGASDWCTGSTASNLICTIEVNRTMFENAVMNNKQFIVINQKEKDRCNIPGSWLLFSEDQEATMDVEDTSLPNAAN